MEARHESSEQTTFRRSSMRDDLITARETLERARRTSAPAPSRPAGSRLKFFGITGAVGVVLGLGGFVLVALALDRTFWVENPDPAWETAGAFGAGFFLCGLGLVAVAIVGSLVVALGPANRR